MDHSTPIIDQVYLISDLHLGAAGLLSSIDREKKVCAWLESIADEMTHLYLVGDIYDHWYEWGEVIPKGYHRWHGLLARLVDAGKTVTIHVGNHDLWQYSYHQDALGIKIHRQPQHVQHNGYDLLIAHGDGLGPGDSGYKWLKKLMTNPAAQWLLSRLHPNLTMKILRNASHTSREHGPEEAQWLGADREWLAQYCNDVVRAHPFDYMVFGHRHLPIVHHLDNSTSTYVNLGDWLHYQTYAKLDADGLQLYFHETINQVIYG